jgi:hypothetical protein
MDENDANKQRKMKKRMTRRGKEGGMRGGNEVKNVHEQDRRRNEKLLKLNRKNE